jgi:hypothetical protein
MSKVVVTNHMTLDGYDFSPNQPDNPFTRGASADR